MYASVFAKTYGFKAIGLSYFNVFGKRQIPNGAYAAVIPKWVSAIINNEDLFINGDGNGTCKMKDAKSEDFWILVWHCGTDGQCTGDAVNGTGRFEGVKGSMNWWNDGGWGEGSGTFIMQK
jgi:hypothetical protein